MKLNLGFLITAVIVLMIYIPAVRAQANLVFTGGNGTPLSITLQQSVVYTIDSTNCSNTPFASFAFDEAGNPYSFIPRVVTGTISFSVNVGGAAQLITRANSGYTVPNDITPNDLYIYNLTGQQFSPGNTVVLNAGTVITISNVAAAPPSNGSFTTFITNNFGFKCSSNGVAIQVSAASVSVSGRVLINNRRGLSNALIYLTDSEGNIRTARTNSFGFYRFEDVQAGQSVTVTVVSKRYQFAPQILNLNEEMNGVNFLADN